MSDLKSALQDVVNKLKGLETRARGLKNQNLADIVASAHGRVVQLSDHPDLELVDERKDQAHEGNPLYVAPATKDEAIDRMRKDGDADPEGTAKANWPHLFGSGPFKPDPDPKSADASQAPFPHQQPQPRADEYGRDGRPA